MEIQEDAQNSKSPEKPTAQNSPNKTFLRLPLQAVVYKYLQGKLSVDSE